MSNFIENSNWRYATKQFDADKKIPQDKLALLKEAIRLSASSYGLQPYRIFIVEDTDTRKKIQEASFNQSQVTEASHLIVFAAMTTFENSDVDAYISNTAKTRAIDIDLVAGYGNYIKKVVCTLPEEEIKNWASKQTYIALTNLINAAAELKIDVTPMEGFIPEKINEILDLESQNLNAVLIAPIGYRSAQDQTQFSAKVRKSSEELFITI